MFHYTLDLFRLCKRCCQKIRLRRVIIRKFFESAVEWIEGTLWNYSNIDELAVNLAKFARSCPDNDEQKFCAHLVTWLDRIARCDLIEDPAETKTIDQVRRCINKNSPARESTCSRNGRARSDLSWAEWGSRFRIAIGGARRDCSVLGKRSIYLSERRDANLAVIQCEVFKNFFIREGFAASVIEQN